MPRWNGSVKVATSCGASCTPVLFTIRVTESVSTAVLTSTVPCSGILCTIALCTRFVANCNKSVGEPVVGVISPVVVTVTPCFSASACSVSVASSAMSDKSTGSRVNDCCSARLSRSNASVSSIARVLTYCSRSSSSDLSCPGPLRATSRSVWVIANGVRSSC
ncbi:hypothetical protein GCM10009569_14610 [Arthrobacter russicus]|uniref:Uncharacterized protein n=1 Tax=Arthrobacter russicus TaxID=172040 RepID=A0ABU1JAJ0_9MICC|nr:hypothetical protein [Arthrobacter russicus]MDR6269433.1 hypothetical protein [Arthrobacter russicus]